MTTFSLLGEKSREKASEFQKVAPNEWESHPCYTELQQACRRLKVVNDTAERGIRLVQQYNETLTKDEEQKQYLLRLVSNHRKALPEPSKALLMNYAEDRITNREM